MRGLNRPSRVPALSVVSLVLSLVGARRPALLALLAVSVQIAGEAGLVMAQVMCFLGILLPIGGLVLGGRPFGKSRANRISAADPWP